LSIQVTHDFGVNSVATEVHNSELEDMNSCQGEYNLYIMCKCAILCVCADYLLQLSLNSKTI